MSRILVPPEVLIRVSDEAGRAAEELERTKNLLDQQITWMMSSWEGTTRSRFFEDFQRAHGEMNKTIEHLRITSQELKKIAFRFIQADMRMDLWNAASAAAGNAEPKNFWDHAGDFWEGLQTGAMSIANSVKDTATSLVDDPVGTVGDMAYNATIGTVEEIVDTAVWGGKMIFDADTREKFAGDVEDAGGTSNFIGQQAAMVLGGLATRRIGVKGGPHLKHDSGGDGGKGVEGKSKIEVTAVLQQRVDEIRAQLPSSIKKSGNLGVAKIEINGFPNEMKAHSSVNFATDKGSDGFVLLKPKEQRNFETINVDKDGYVGTDKAYSREWDTEVKILEDVASKLGANRQASGTIDLFTERLACASCSDVILEFRRKYPNIQLNVHTGKK